MMKTVTSLVLFASTLKADVCITGEGDTNIGFYGHYVELGPDSNGDMQYKETTICGDNYLYRYQDNWNDLWGTSHSLGDISMYLRCQNSSISTPMDCPQWSINSVDVKETDCEEVVLTCDTIEISGAFSTSNGIFNKVENEDNLYKKEGADYWFLYYANRRYFVGTDDGDMRCSNSVGYDLKIAESDLSTLKDGVTLTFNPTFPSSNEITIKCSGNSTPPPATTTTAQPPSTPAPSTEPPSTSATVINTPQPTTTTAGGPGPVGSSDDDICISSGSDSNYNAVFFGNYVYAGKDSNDNTYYEKEQEHCDDEMEYLYLTTSGYWQTHITLGTEGEYYLRCPTQNIATPNLCSDEWLNGRRGADPDISASNVACPEMATPSLSCDSIEIVGASNSFWNKVYTKVDENYYKMPTNVHGDFYLQFYEQGGYYIIWTSDVRDACPNGQSYYLRADDRNIDNLEQGDILSVELVYPEGDTVSFKCLATA